MKPCPHKLLRKQLSGMQVWYVCSKGTYPSGKCGVVIVEGCGKKFKAVEWDGKVKVK